MKNLLLAIFIITGFVACKSDPDLNQNRDIHLLSDSSAYNNSVFSDTIATTAETEPVPAKTTIGRKATKKSVVRRTATKRPDVQVSTPVINPPVTVPQTATPPIIPAPSNDNSTVGNTGSGNTNSTSTVPEVQKKKGWNKATQGAVIGGVTGAVGGAIISKKKGVGAVVGAIAGAAGGYIIGKKMDKKDNKFVIE